MTKGLSNIKCEACGGYGLASEATVEKQEARRLERDEEIRAEERQWRLAAEAVLGAITIQGVPALEYIERVVNLGRKIAA